MKTRDGEALGGSAPTAAQAFGFAQQQNIANTYQASQAVTPYAPQAAVSYAPQAVPYAAPAPTGQINPVTGMPM